MRVFCGLIAEKNGMDNHPLFTDKMRIYSDSKVADFITGITPDQSVGFLNEWNARRDHREKIYIS